MVSHSPPLAMEALLGTTFILGVLLNAAVLRGHARRGVLRWLAVSWCLCNLLSMAGTPLLVATLHHGSWPAGSFFCRAYMSSSTLGQWAGAWLLVAATVQLVPRPGLSFCLAPLCILVVTPAALVFTYSELHETDTASHCILDISGYNEHLSVTLVTFIFSYNTPLTLAACFLFTAFWLGRDRGFSGSWYRVVLLHVALLVTHMLLWLPYWATQLQLLMAEDGSVTPHLVAGLLGQTHAAIVVPTVLLALARQTAGPSRQTSVRTTRSPPNVPASDLESQEDLLMDNSRRSSFNVGPQTKTEGSPV